MTRRNISLPDDLDEAARKSGINVSAVAQAAIADELERQDRMRRLDSWLDELDAEHGEASPKAKRDAAAWFALAKPVVARGQRKVATRRRAAG